MSESVVATQGRFLYLEISCGTIIAAEIFQAVVDLKLESSEELVLTKYHCHDRGSIAQSECLTIMLISLFNNCNQFSLIFN